MNPGVTSPYRRLCPVTPQLFLSGELPPGWEEAHEALAVWVDAGVTDIVDVRIEGDDSSLVAYFHPELGYHHHATDDDGRHRPHDWFAEGTASILEVLDNPGRVAVVHCAMGVNRGPSMAFAAMVSSGWEPYEALTAIRTARPVAVVLYAEDAVRWVHRDDHAARDAAVAEVHRWFLDHIEDAEWVIGRWSSLGEEGA